MNKIFGVTGWKNTGKTTMMEALVREFTTRGLRISTIKHAHHNVDVDQPGKDSYRHRIAGAYEVILASKTRWALMHEHRDEDEAPLAELLEKLAPVDLVLVEGYKRDRHPKIEVALTPHPKGLIAVQDPTICAVALGYQASVDQPKFDINDIESIANFILKEIGYEQSA